MRRAIGRLAVERGEFGMRIWHHSKGLVATLDPGVQLLDWWKLIPMEDLA